MTNLWETQHGCRFHPRTSRQTHVYAENSVLIHSPVPKTLEKGKKKVILSPHFDFCPVFFRQCEQIQQEILLNADHQGLTPSTAEVNKDPVSISGQRDI